MQVTVVALVLAGAFFSLLLLVPSRHVHPAESVRGTTAATASSASPELVSDTLLNASLLDATVTPTMPNSSERHEREQPHEGLNVRSDASFWLAFVSRSAGLLFLNPVINLSDALALAVTSRVFEIKGPPGAGAEGGEAAVDEQMDEESSTEHELRAELKHEYKTGDWLEISVPRKQSTSNASGPVDKDLDLCHESALLSKAAANDLKAAAVAEAAESEAIPARRRLDQQRDRAYGMFCAVGAVGWLLMSGGAALVTEVLVPGSQPGDLFMCSLVAGLALWVLTSIAICLYRPAAIRAGGEVFSHVMQFVRQPETLRLFAILFVEGFFQGVLDTNLYLYDLTS